MSVFEPAPIAVFTYNRLEHLEKTILSLSKNRGAIESNLFIFSDGPKNENDLILVNEVRKYLTHINGFKSVNLIYSEVNLGLSRSITQGINYVLQSYDNIIVLEDDLITSECFLDYMNEALQLYKNDTQVCEIMGYSFIEKYVDLNKIDTTFFLRGGDSLGWGTWRRAWKFYEENTQILINELYESGLVNLFNKSGSHDFFSMLNMQLNGQIDSWAIRWYASTFLKNMLTLYPTKSMVLHIGNDGKGTNYNNHLKDVDPLIVPLFKGGRFEITKIPVVESQLGLLYHKRYLDSYKLNLREKFLVKLKNLINDK